MQARQPLSASQKNTKKFFEHFPDTGIIRIIIVELSAPRSISTPRL